MLGKLVQWDLVISGFSLYQGKKTKKYKEGWDQQNYFCYKRVLLYPTSLLRGSTVAVHKIHFNLLFASFHLCAGDLQRISELEPKLAATAEFYAMYIECKLTLAKRYEKMQLYIYNRYRLKNLM